VPAAAAAAEPIVESLEWTAPLSIIKYPDPRLRAVNAKIAVFDQTLANLANQMFDIMYQ
jgi:peptide deformylase